MIQRDKKVGDKKLLKQRKSTVTEASCADCPGLCCHDLVMVLEKPKTKDDFDTFLWYLQYENSFVYLLDGKWHHLVRTVCIYLNKKTKLCTNYDRRQQKCLDHKPPACERYGEWFDIFFETPEDLMRYAEENGLLKKFAKKSVKKSSKKKTSDTKSLKKKSSEKKTPKKSSKKSPR